MERRRQHCVIHTSTVTILRMHVLVRLAARWRRHLTWIWVSGSGVSRLRRARRSINGLLGRSRLCHPVAIVGIIRGVIPGYAHVCSGEDVGRLVVLVLGKPTVHSLGSLGKSSRVSGILLERLRRGLLLIAIAASIARVLLLGRLLLPVKAGGSANKSSGARSRVSRIAITL